MHFIFTSFSSIVRGVALNSVLYLKTLVTLGTHENGF